MFILLISETELSKEKGLSAAGANVEALPYTAPADADMLYYDRPKVIDCIPLDPFGHPTPALVTKAAVMEGRLPVMNIRAGTSVAPVAPFTDLGAAPGRDPRLGPAVPDFLRVSKRAAEAAGDLAGRGIKRFVLAESIPGGTTTALLLLRSLGYDGTVSSAGPVNPLSKKEEIWNAVASRLGIKTGGMKGKGLQPRLKREIRCRYLLPPSYPPFPKMPKSSPGRHPDDGGRRAAEGYEGNEALMVAMTNIYAMTQRAVLSNMRKRR